MKRTMKRRLWRSASGAFLFLGSLSCDSSSQHSVDAGMNAPSTGVGGVGGSGGALGGGGGVDANGADGFLSAAAQQYVTTYAEPYS